MIGDGHTPMVVVYHDGRCHTPMVVVYYDG